MRFYISECHQSKNVNQFQQLCCHISELAIINDLDKKCISERFKIKQLKKKEILLAGGSVSNHMRFIFHGCLYTYAMDANDVERILQIGIENWWVNDLNSFFTKAPAAYSIKAIEESVVIQIL